MATKQAKSSRVSRRTRNMRSKTNFNKVKKAYIKSKTGVKQAKQEYRGKTAAQRRQEIREAKHSAKIREIDAKAKMAEQKPGIYKETVRAENELKATKARAAGRTASASALASGMATLGKGLSDENNQDAIAERQHETEMMKTIFGKSNTSEDGGDYGLTQGVE